MSAYLSPLSGGFPPPPTAPTHCMGQGLDGKARADANQHYPWRGVGSIRPIVSSGGKPVLLHRANTAGRAASPSQGQGRIHPPGQPLTPAQPMGCRGTLQLCCEPLSRLDPSRDGPQEQKVQLVGPQMASPTRYRSQREKLRSSLPLQLLRWK